MPLVARLSILALLLVACAGAADTTTTTAASSTTTHHPATTTTFDLEVTKQGCGSPPVTFSALCEAYELLETWHVDAPMDTTALAGAALDGLEAFDSSETESPPRALICAVPDAAFDEFCDVLAERVENEGLPVGQAVEAALSYMVETSLDPFTYYLPPEQAGSVRLNGIVGGVGVLLDSRDAAGSKCSQLTLPCRLEVVFVLEDNPGFDAGLAAGDIITAVDGDPVDGKRFTEVVAEIAGDESGTVILTIDRGGTPMEIPIERTEVSGPTVEYGVPVDEVGYLRIPDFEYDIPSLVYDSLVDIGSQSPDTLVVDLRDNPGGYVEVLIEIVDEFVDGGVVMITDAPGEHFEYEAEPGGIATGPRLVVLVNNGTASAAEILAGALRDRRGAVIVGTDTFGKDAVQIPFTLRNGGEFYVAVARWSTPEGATVGSGGLQPDFELQWPENATVEDVVQLALEASR
jgi:carboxyl-terminal processing protease